MFKVRDSSYFRYIDCVNDANNDLLKAAACIRKYEKALV